MGDYWLNEHDNIVKLINSLTADIKEYSIQQRNNPGIVQKNTPAKLRNGLVHITNEILRLQDSLTYGNNRNIQEKELLRRKNKVESLISMKNQLNSTLDAAINNTSQKNELMGNNNGVGIGYSNRQFGKPKETEATKQFDNQQLFTNQQHIMREQDESLDLLSQSIMRQKNMAHAMSNELDQHNEMLDDVEIGTDAVSMRLRNANRRMETIKQNAGSTCMIVCIVILIILIVVLIATDSGCKIYNDPKHCP
ncbi:hypothetical protein DDB_G0288439 [Dictyostelium discoideum AX4]|uniref:Probable syntaxin-8B n=1 Tax=Dictyostelium discoideum TaxID=44689 RepID=STX8B_DICDI|nr:hypothetical protein DDB_G0288439 [Dictyostelium discoideum AX4]Q54IX6.1 RecName: Full=Probable syntaxin-8B [Dictyostelium discoideum]EAL63245.1 hypothetical protein DDB_G0288439 [Dictyostelium discoideum AX4]|eukprot:XP_636754.1 hypothetical protein DDB_G0288439 [Dictyostelium discoideum AX4]